MPDLLLILNPRNIEECVESYRELCIDRLWISRFSEPGVEEIWPTVMEMTEGYDRMLIVSDDAIVRQPALNAVIRLLDEGHPVANGYANLDTRDWRVTLNKAPLPEQSTAEAFDFMTLDEAMAYPVPEIPTTNCAFALTGMERELWQRFGFSNRHGASDFTLSTLLTWHDIPMVAAREGFIWHVKEVWNAKDLEPRKGLLVDKEPPRLIMENAACDEWEVVAG